MSAFERLSTFGTAQTALAVPRSPGYTDLSAWGF
jgi:hypothetical protein